MNRLAALSVVTSLLLSVTSCSPRTASDAASPMQRVETVVVERQTAPSETSVDGTVIGLREATVSSRLLLTVAAVEVRAGDTVRAGTVLVRLDTREVDGAFAGATAGLASARTSLEVARRNVQRFENLSSTGAAAAVELDRARMDEASANAQLRSAESSLRRAETDRSLATLTAPFDAVVVDRLVEAGDLALPGKPLVRLASLEGRRVEAALTEEAAAALLPKQPMVMLLGAERLEGRLEEIVAAVDSASRRRVVRVALPPGAKTAVGSFARILVPGASVERLAVPSAAIVRAGGLETAFVVGSDARLSLRYVKTGIALPNGRVEILSGLDAGERVVLRPGSALASGTSVSS